MRHARYQGRHRSPSTTARVTATTSRVTAIGAVGVGTVAATVLAPSAAHAATGVQWDRVAHCESTDNWHDNTGNGYYGGLQFSQRTWDSFDTENYASRADLASREQQITVANRVLDRQGWNAWPVCGHDAGAPGPVDTSHTHKAHSSKTDSTHKLLSHRDAKVVGAHAKWVHYVVKSGDTLAGIAEHHHVKGGWHSVYAANRHVIGGNPSVIHTGMTLKLLAHRV